MSDPPDSGQIGVWLAGPDYRAHFSARDLRPGAGLCGMPVHGPASRSLRRCGSCNDELERLNSFNLGFRPPAYRPVDPKALVLVFGSPKLVEPAPLAPHQCAALHAAVGQVSSRRASLHSGVHHSVYAALLQGVPGDTAVSFYVGMTGLRPDQRYRNHRDGVHSGRGWIKKYGVGLALELYAWLNPMSEENARAVEPELADAIRSAGFDVHQA